MKRLRLRNLNWTLHKENLMSRKSELGINELLDNQREVILEIAAKHGAYNLRVFGSVARSEADEQSDIVFASRVLPCSAIRHE